MLALQGCRPATTRLCGLFFPAILAMGFFVPAATGNAQPQASQNVPAVSADRKTAEAHFKRGLQLSVEEKWKEAEAELREAVRLDPTNPTYRSFLADALTAQGKQREARQFSDKEPPPGTATGAAGAVPSATPPPATLGVPGSAAEHHARGTVFYESEDWRRAEAEFREAVRLDPRSAESWDALGDTLSRQERWKEAEAAYREAVRLVPEESYYHAQLAGALQRENRRDAAMEEALEAVRLGLEDHWVLDELGLAVTRLKE